MNQENPLIIERDGPVCTVMINNPDKHNVLTPLCFKKLIETFDELSQDKDLRVTILRGKGMAAFSAGADISEMPERDVDDQSGIHEDAASACEVISRHPFPVVAMLSGYTLGAGCILAMASDIRIAGKSLKMGIPTSRMGLISDFRTFKRFLTVMGLSTALEIFLTGRFYDSRESLEMGLVNHVVANVHLESYVHDLAQDISRCAPLSLKGSKFILNRIAESPVPSSEDIETFRSLRTTAVQSKDHEEAKRAFKEKRPPQFKGR